MNELDIQKAIYNWRLVNGHQLIMKNIHLLHGENDMISVTQAGFIHEYEIKVTKSDFKADTKKHKHPWLKRKDYRYAPNYFWYAVVENIIFESAIPEYAGLIWITNLKDRWGNNLYVVKNAPRLHTRKITNKQITKIADTALWQLWKIILEE